MDNQTLQWGPVSEEDDLHPIVLPDGNTVYVLRYITASINRKVMDAAMVMKQKLSVGNRAARRSGKGKTQSNQTEVSSDFSAGSFRFALLLEMVKQWTFTDKNKQPIPVNAKTIGNLPNHTKDFIMEEIDRLNPDYGEVEDEDELDPENLQQGISAGSQEE